MSKKSPANNAEAAAVIKQAEAAANLPSFTEIEEQAMHDIAEQMARPQDTPHDPLQDQVQSLDPKDVKAKLDALWENLVETARRKYIAEEIVSILNMHHKEAKTQYLDALKCSQTEWQKACQTVLPF